MVGIFYKNTKTDYKKTSQVFIPVRF